MQKQSGDYAFKINKIVIKNSLYTISIKGKVNSFQDDVLPSGYLTVSIENIENLIGLAKGEIAGIVESDESLIHSFDASYGESEVSADSYRQFLQKVSEDLSVVVPELAARNPLTTEQSATFDVGREKNLDFVINEVSIQEILGKILTER